MIHIILVFLHMVRTVNITVIIFMKIAYLHIATVCICSNYEFAFDNDNQIKLVVAIHT